MTLEQFKEKAVAALRSGKYTQGYKCLRRKSVVDGHPDTYCALGVIADTINPDGWSEEPNGYLEYSWHRQPDGFKHRWTLDTPVLRGEVPKELHASIIHLNDVHHQSFDKIADWIEENV
jgi:hypothetical protein